MPASWRWVALRRLPYHGSEISFFATREHLGDHASDFHISATTEVETNHSLEVYAEDATETVRVGNPDVCHVALRRQGEAVLLIGHAGVDTSVVPVDLGALLSGDTMYSVELYDSESYAWRLGETATGSAHGTFAVSIAAGGYKILKFREA